MFLGAGEIVVVLAVALMVLGPKKMPEVARSLARFVAQLRRMADDVRSQVDDALQDTPPKPEPRQQPTLPPAGVHDAAPKSDAGSGDQSVRATAPTPNDDAAADEGPNAPGGPTPKVS